MADKILTFNGKTISGPGGTATGDMPGTLDYTTLGPFTYKTGTYSSSSDVHFGFYVTDKSPATIAGLADLSVLFTDKWALLNNAYLLSPATMKYLTSI